MVLTTSTFVLCNIVGRYLKDHIDEWHKRNPSQLAVAQLMYTHWQLLACKATIAPDDPPSMYEAYVEEVKLIRSLGLVRAFGSRVSRMAVPTYWIQYYGLTSLI